MVEIEKYFKIEIEMYRIENFRTEIEIGFYRIGRNLWISTIS